MMPSEIAAQPVPNRITRQASTERTASRTPPPFRAGSTSDGASDIDIRGPAERPNDGASSSLMSVVFGGGAAGMQIVPGQTPGRDQRLDFRGFALRRAAFRRAAFENRARLPRRHPHRGRPPRRDPPRRRLILLLPTGFVAVVGILLECVDVLIEVVGLGFRLRLGFRLEQPGNIACDAPFVPAEAPHTGFRIDDASVGRVRQCRKGIRAVSLAPEQHEPILVVLNCRHAATRAPARVPFERNKQAISALNRLIGKVKLAMDGSTNSTGPAAGSRSAAGPSRPLRSGPCMMPQFSRYVARTRTAPRYHPLSAMRT